MKKDEWQKNIKKREDTEKQAEKLLRRMKRDIGYCLAVDGQYLCAGYKIYILNANFITKSDAKKWIMDRIWHVTNAKTELEFQRIEKECLYIKDRILVEYLSEVDLGFDRKMHYRITTDAGKWRIFERKIVRNEKGYEFDFGERFNTAEEAMTAIGTRYDGKIQNRLDIFN